jgi:hypothetical protein
MQKLKRSGTLTELDSPEKLAADWHASYAESTEDGEVSSFQLKPEG